MSDTPASFPPSLTALPPSSQEEAALGVRVGSPFAEGSAMPTFAIHSMSDQVGAKVVSGGHWGGAEQFAAGAWGETITAASWAAWILTVFSVAAWVSFPAGGVVIASLGIVVSALGIRSRNTKRSVLAFAIHLSIAIACYVKAMWPN